MSDYALTYLWICILVVGGALGALLAHAADELWAGRRRFDRRRR